MVRVIPSIQRPFKEAGVERLQRLERRPCPASRHGGAQCGRFWRGPTRLADPQEGLAGALHASRRRHLPHLLPSRRGGVGDGAATGPARGCSQSRCALIARVPVEDEIRIEIRVEVEDIHIPSAVFFGGVHQERVDQCFARLLHEDWAIPKHCAGEHAGDRDSLQTDPIQVRDALLEHPPEPPAIPQVFDALRSYRFVILRPQDVQLVAHRDAHDALRAQSPNEVQGVPPIPGVGRLVASDLAPNENLGPVPAHKVP
mmetsp:Transcript_47428/g.93898  ORF Transcript_47428/g.93898 Transcript_47428/m.93898 type:complete len:257 (-) Transcript_47428:204-974(-)